MPIRSLSVLVALIIAGCGGGEEAASSGPPSAGGAATEAAAQEDACAITREQLAAYLPRSLLGESAAVDRFSPTAVDRAVGVRLDYGEVEGFAFPVTLGLYDLSRDPMASSMKALVLEASDTDASYDSFERRTVDGVGPLLYTVTDGGTAETLTIFANDLYLLLTHREVAGLDKLLDALGQTDVIDALDRDCNLVVAGMPAWLTEAETMAGGAPAEAPAEQVAVIENLPGCDEILPPETVANICGVAATTAKPTPFETPGRNCNRSYGIPDERDGLIFLLTNYGDARQARQAVEATAGGGENYRELESLPDLGQGGERYIHEAMDPTYTVRFASHGALVELKNAESPVRGSQFCLDLDEVEAIGRAVDEKLSALAR